MTQAGYAGATMGVIMGGTAVGKSVVSDTTADSSGKEEEEDKDNTTMAELALYGGPSAGDASLLTEWPIVDMKYTLGLMEDVIKSGNYGSSEVVTGKMMKRFEEGFAKYCGVKHALMTTSGTSALQIALAAAKVKEGDEVLVPAFSWCATPMCVVLRGAIPIFVDVDASGNIDPKLFAAAVGPRTKAVLAVHLHGNPLNLEAIHAAAKPLGLAVVEDAAQAHGAMWHGRRIGGASVDGAPVMAVFSLQQSKNVPAGEGGIFVTDCDEAAKRAATARSFGLVEHGEGRALASELGGMHRGNELAAALAVPQLEALEGRVVAANANFQRLAAAVESLPGLWLVGAVTAEEAAQGSRSGLHKIRLAFDLDAAGLGAFNLEPRVFRNVLVKALEAEGVDAVYWERLPLSDHPIFNNACKSPDSEDFPAWAKPDPPRYGANVQAAYPMTRKLLDGSVVLFSQKRPFIAQTTSAVDAMARAVVKVWAKRMTLAARLADESRG
jgi:dTDP-4-amino-4,6-dideoxygalactose transaminase